MGSIWESTLYSMPRSVGRHHPMTVRSVEARRRVRQAAFRELHPLLAQPAYYAAYEKRENLSMLSRWCEPATMLAMKSPILVLLLIVSLFACPLRCLSCNASVAASELSAPLPVCSCCSHCRDTPDSDLPLSNAPSPCKDDCHCQACICEGAVLEAEIELPDERLDSKPLFSSVAPILAARILTRHETARHIEFLMRCSFASSRQLLCGRDALIAHQSWLI